MHQVIYVIVKQEENATKYDALEEAKVGLDTLVHERETIFDYYTTFDDSESTRSGEARFGEHPIAKPLYSDTGSQWFENAKQNQWEKFEERLNTIKEAITNNTNHELYNDSMIQYKFRQLGEMTGSSVSLYNDYGGGLENDKKISNFIEDVDKECLWIVPADVHY
jgi:hypothetical protein